MSPYAILMLMGVVLMVSALLRLWVQHRRLTRCPECGHRWSDHDVIRHGWCTAMPDMFPVPCLCEVVPPEIEVDAQVQRELQLRKRYPRTYGEDT